MAALNVINTLNKRIIPDITSGISPDSPVNKERVGQVRGLREGASSRLREMRDTRESRLSANMQPVLQNIAEQEAQAGRNISRGPQGSMSNVARADLSAGADLSRQELGVEELGQVLNQEGGAQRLELMFNDMFNAIGDQAFSETLQGLGSEANKYLTEQGASLDLARIKNEAARASNDMAGRFITAAGMEAGRSGSSPSSGGASPAFGQVTSKPSVFNQSSGSGIAGISGF